MFEERLPNFKPKTIYTKFFTGPVLGQANQAGFIAGGTPATRGMAEKEDQRLVDGRLGMSMVPAKR